MSVYPAPTTTSTIFNNRDYLSLDEIPDETNGPNSDNTDHSGFVTKFGFNTLSHELSLPSIKFTNDAASQNFPYSNADRTSLANNKTDLSNSFVFNETNTQSLKNTKLTKIIFPNDDEQISAFTEQNKTNLSNNTSNLSNSFIFNTPNTEFKKDVKLNKIIFGNEPFDEIQEQAYTSADHAKLNNLSNYVHNELDAFNVDNTISCNDLRIKQTGSIIGYNINTNATQWELTNRYGTGLSLQSINEDIRLTSASNKNVVIFSKGLILMSTNVGVPTSITMNNEVQHFAFTNSNRNQIETNKTNIANINVNNSHKFFATFFKNSLAFAGFNMSSGATLGNTNDHFDYMISSDLKTWIDAYNVIENAKPILLRMPIPQYFGNIGSDTVIIGDFGLLSIAVDVEYSNTASSHAFVYRIQTQIVLLNSAGNFHHGTPLTGHRTTNQPTCHYNKYSVNAIQYLKFQDDFIGKTMHIRSRVHLQTPSVGTSNIGLSVTVVKL